MTLCAGIVMHATFFHTILVTTPDAGTVASDEGRLHLYLNCRLVGQDDGCVYSVK